jgi:ribosome recycling factor
LEKTGVGANPVVDRDSIRINLPALTEEYRRDLQRLISEKQEEARRTMRHWREDAWSEVQERTKAGEIREDDKFRAKEDLQKMVDDACKKIEEIGDRKKEEVLE